MQHLREKQIFCLVGRFAGPQVPGNSFVARKVSTSCRQQTASARQDVETFHVFKGKC